MKLRKNLPLIILIAAVVIIFIIFGIGIYYNLKDIELSGNVLRGICIVSFLIVVLIITELLSKREPIRQYKRLEETRERLEKKNENNERN